jgi:hypothetical protein
MIYKCVLRFIYILFYKIFLIFFGDLTMPLWMEGDSHELVQFPTKFREKNFHTRGLPQVYEFGI